MPGINLIKYKDSSLTDASKLDRIQDKLNILSGYSSHQIISSSKMYMGYNSYKEYPIKVIKNSNWTIVVEGKIYNQTDEFITSALKNISECHATALFSKNIEKFINCCDGDFIVYFVNENSLYVFNDIFGRIPIYYSETDQLFIISRHIKFFSELIPSLEINITGISEFLLLGYMIGTNTILKNVFHLRPASLISITDNKLDIKIFPTFNFDNKENKSVPFLENIKKISELFSKACIDRFRNHPKNIVTLSGGLDSRLVASAMFKAKIPYEAVTMAYNNGYATEEIQIAKNLANIYGVHCENINIDPPKWENIQELSNIKNGMVSLATSPIIPFYYSLLEKYGQDINYITGDNGDKIMFTLDVPKREFKDIEELTDFFIEQHSVLQLKQISELTGVTESELKEKIKSTFLAFPERDLFQKYVHWRAIEKPFNYAFQGEDRHRNYFWNISPFWSQDYFRYLMNCDDKIKRKHRVFRAHLDTYSPKATDQVYSNFKSSITSFKGKMTMFAIYNIYPRIPITLKHKLKKSFFAGNPTVSKNYFLFEVLNKVNNDNEIIKKYLNLYDLENKNLSKVPLYNILTICAAILEFSGKNNELLKFSELSIKDEN